MSTSKTDATIGDAGAQEQATVVHEGKEFAAGGFYLNAATGRMVGYVATLGGALWLTTWGGLKIAPLRCTGKSRGFHGAQLHHYQTSEPYLGHHWHGKGQGEGMIIRMRRGREGKKEEARS